MTLTEEMTRLGAQARLAAHASAKLSTEQKNAVLHAMADAIDRNLASLQEANRNDMEAGVLSNLSPALLDRLRLDEKRIHKMSQGLREVANLPDPVGRVLDERTRPNGLRLRKVSAPIGVIVIIYESRPNVTADAAGLCLKSGNATILRGGKEAIHSNRAIAKVMVRAARDAVPAFPEHGIQVVPTTDRDAIAKLLSLTQYIDLCMPRGGEGLIRAVAECSKVPVIKHYKGVCHVYVDADADLKMAEGIVLNAKLQRPAVCNAMETLLIHQSIAPELLRAVVPALMEKNVELHVDEGAKQCLAAEAKEWPRKPAVLDAVETDWTTEYNDYALNIRTVKDTDEAIAHINLYGSSHSDAIVTNDQGNAQRFLTEVDSAAVYWNASTRFTDGAEFGMGAEIGISTDKVGARGPMGLEELTTYKWLGLGSGQIRH